MKIKLLKKIRKRFSIIFYPVGTLFPLWRERILDKDLYLLIDSDDDSNWSAFETKEHALKVILEIIRKQYKKYSQGYRNRKNSKKIKTVWYIQQEPLQKSNLK